jgi:hypothetical protein
MKVHFGAKRSWHRRISQDTFVIVVISIIMLYVPDSAPLLTCESRVNRLPDFRIFDIVLYHNEAYMLLLRLRTLRPYVTKHYIGFSLQSFSHRVNAPLSFDPFFSEITSFSERYFWFNYTHPAALTESWDREADIRNQLIHEMELIELPQPEDLVMWSDLDEIPIPRGMRYVIENPPTYYYRFWGHFHFYNLRWRSREIWKWAYIMKYGARHPNHSWFQFRFPNKLRWRRVPGVSMVHCSYCFPSLGLIISKLLSFSHQEFAGEPFINPNYVYSYVYCGYSLFGGNFTFVDFDPSLGLDFPPDARYDFMIHRLKFDDLDKFKFDVDTMTSMSPCKLPFAEKWRSQPSFTLPNNLMR